MTGTSRAAHARGQGNPSLPSSRRASRAGGSVLDLGKMDTSKHPWIRLLFHAIADCCASSVSTPPSRSQGSPDPCRSCGGGSFDMHKSNWRGSQRGAQRCRETISCAEEAGPAQRARAGCTAGGVACHTQASPCRVGRWQSPEKQAATRPGRVDVGMPTTAPSTPP